MNKRIYEKIDKNNKVRLIRAVEKELTERERLILKLSFGIGLPEMSLEEIGEKFGLTRERVRQVLDFFEKRIKYEREP